jgi:hypothetical protein
MSGKLRRLEKWRPLSRLTSASIQGRDLVVALKETSQGPMFELRLKKHRTGFVCPLKELWPVLAGWEGLKQRLAKKHGTTYAPRRLKDL